VSSNGHQERAPGSLGRYPSPPSLNSPNKKAPQEAFGVGILVNLAAILHYVRVAAEEARGFWVGLALMESSGQSANNDRHANNYRSHYPVFSLI
jgi:hypothetical protein